MFVCLFVFLIIFNHFNELRELRAGYKKKLRIPTLSKEFGFFKSSIFGDDYEERFKIK